MYNIAIILEDGFEEIEAITPYDILKRCGINVTLVNTDENEVTGSHGLRVCTSVISDFSNFDAIILPGGGKGAVNLSNNKIVIDTVRDFVRKGKLVAAICASPAVVLEKANVISGLRVTCYPGMERNFTNSIYIKEKVVVDHNIITSAGPGTSAEFAFAILKYLGVNYKNVFDDMLY